MCLLQAIFHFEVFFVRHIKLASEQTAGYFPFQNKTTPIFLVSRSRSFYYVKISRECRFYLNTSFIIDFTGNFNSFHYKNCCTVIVKKITETI